ncbi:Carboxypeptidase regulatory-like domain-containing protein [Granulicella rosea]|uniref:Carboxypeptidase regulatory-like domain-containing protein n=1 Tax=Granulicella rosea TaxID=474952 RepID=A0A239M1G3_9BACT|nr:carboxypeptidase-like regulatory domain-containing protein [Granulicella rosea]SNT36380.1 Carboxypeptidase regulatory-like domain-containing protein [Granulicella rosea]
MNQQISRFIRFTFSFVLVLLLLVGGRLTAQEFRGTISGTVSDSGGAIIPQAAVTVRDTDTGAVYKVKSDDKGFYSASSLAPGKYEVRVESPSFQAYIRNGITVQAGDHASIDVTLTAGDVSQSVTVTSDAPMVDATNAAIGQSISTKEVEDLPQNGRTPVVLAQLALGVSSTSPPAQVRPFDNGGAASITVAGAKNQTTETLLDGSPDTDSQLKVAYSPPQDVVQEVKVYAFQVDAAYGHSGGGIINQVTKGGGNHLHGSIYEYNQTAAFTANNYFSKRNGTPRPNTHYNQYGASFGGPVYIPKLFNGRDKVFFQFGYEGIRDSQPSSGYLHVPTDPEKNGDFSDLLAAGGASYTIYDPSTAVLAGTTVTRTAFAGNKLTTPVNPVAAALLKYYPEPNVPGATAATLNNYFNNFASTDTYDNQFGRMDFNITTRNKLFFDVRHNNRVQSTSNYFGNAATGALLTRVNWGAVVDDVHAFNASTVGNVRFNWTRYASLTGGPSQGADVTSVGYPGSLETNTNLKQLPSVAIGSTGACNKTSTETTFACLFTPNNTPNANWNDSFHIFGSVTKVLGNHSIKAGADAREYRIENISYGYPTGQFVYGTSFTQQSSTSAAAPFGQDLAAFELGLPTSGSINRNVFTATWNRYLGVFGQDDWRVAKSLTLNIGLRFDHDFPLYERHNRAISSFDPTLTTPVGTAAATAYNANPISQIPAGQFQAPGGVVYASDARRQLYNTDSYTFSPRLGFAWTPPNLNGKTTVTGGFSIFVFPVQNLATINSTGYSTTTAYVATNNNYLTPATTIANPFPTGLIQAAGASGGAATNQGLATQTFNQHMKNGYSERYALSVQQQFDANTVFQLAYIGAHYVKLQVGSISLNPIPQQYLSASPVKNVAQAAVLTGSVANPFAGLLPGTTLNAATIARGQLLTAYPQYPISGLTLADVDNGSSNYNSLNARIQHRISKGLSVIANYTYSKNIEQVTKLNDSDTKYEKRVSSFDYPHKLVIATTYTLPYSATGGSGFASHVTHAVLGGWAVSGIYLLQSGAPIGFGNIIYSGGPLNLNPRQTAPKTPAFDVSQFDTATADQPTASVNGVTVQTNIRTLHSTFGQYRADKVNNIDASVARQFKFRELVTGELRMEAFNALNHAEFGAPNMTPTSGVGTFGTISSQANNPRVVQLSGHIRF